MKTLLTCFAALLLSIPQSTVNGPGTINGPTTLSAGSSGATFAYVSGKLCTGTGPLSCSYSPTAGHHIRVGAYICFDGGACTSTGTGWTQVISDNVNNPETCFTVAPSSPVAVNDSGGFHEQWYWWDCPSIPGSVTTFTTTGKDAGTPTSTFSAIWITDYTCSGCSGSWDKDGAAVSSVSGTTGSAPTTGATTNSHDFCAGMVDNDNDENQTSFGAGWAQRFNDGGGNGVLQTLSTTTTGIQTVSATWTGNDSWFAEVGCVD